MDIVRFVLESNGFDRLNPVQEAAVSAGVLEGKNVVVASPTASGKTLIAELAMIAAITSGRKAVYTCPLRALASEHYEDFVRKYPYDAALSVGDYDSSDPWLEKYNAIFTTYEKLDSLVRHGARWLGRVGVLVVDEVHEIDSDRGPTLEVLITRLRRMYPLQIVALSATIPNAWEIAGWLNAQCVNVNWRPVELKEGVYFGGEVLFSDGTVRIIQARKDDIEALVVDTLEMGKQALVFTMSRRNAEALAKRLAPVVSRYIRVRTPLRRISEKILGALETPTKQCRALAECVKSGVAFHHAGLVASQRKVVEDGFRSGHILVVVATPTLAAGVNLPSFRVIFHSLRRYGVFGSYPIPVREYKQMAGRAGRPRYDSYGEAIIVARSAEEKEHLLTRYILGDPEDVYSRLGSEPALRFHTLALCAAHENLEVSDIFAFFSDTFYAYQYGNLTDIRVKLDIVLSELNERGFLRRDGDTLAITPLGARVSQLYIDPLSARGFVQYIKHPKLGELALLYVVSDTSEQAPYLPVPSRLEGGLWALAEERAAELPVDPFSTDDPLFLNKFRLALLLEDWINEKTEDEILDTYDVSPGVLRARVSVAEWLVYAVAELAKLLKAGNVWRYADRMQLRIRYGVKEDILKLVQLRGVGRVKARKLYTAGIRSIRDIQRIDVRTLARIVGPKTAKNLKEQVGEKVKLSDVRGITPQEQTTLDLFIE